MELEESERTGSTILMYQFTESNTLNKKVSMTIGSLITEKRNSLESRVVLIQVTVLKILEPDTTRRETGNTTTKLQLQESVDWLSIQTGSPEMTLKPPP